MTETKISNIEQGTAELRRTHKESIGWEQWATQRMYVLSGAQLVVMKFLKTFVDFSPRQEPGSFSVDAILKKLKQSDGPTTR